MRARRSLLARADGGSVPAARGRFPPPLVRGGLGRGVVVAISHASISPPPPLTPPHASGEGNRRGTTRGREPPAASTVHRGSALRRVAHDRPRRPLPARHAAGGAGRRRRADRRAVLPDRRHADAVRDRARPRAARAHRAGDPLARRAAREPARARPADRGRPRGRLARPDPDGAHAARARARRQGARALAHHRPAAGDRGAAARLPAQSRSRRRPARWR